MTTWSGRRPSRTSSPRRAGPARSSSSPCGTRCAATARATRRWWSTTTSSTAGRSSPARSSRRPRPRRRAPRGSATIVPDDVLLFRYSALTFNGHRIHYDRRYVTEVEGYPGLIVHGPLLATLLLDLLRRNAPDADVATFRFRAVRPTFDLHPFQVNGEPGDDGTVRLWSQDHEGWLTMDAVATLR